MLSTTDLLTFNTQLSESYFQTIAALDVGPVGTRKYT